MTSDSGERRSAPSRGEIECLCVLSAISDDGLEVKELPVRLGLSPLLVKPVSEALAPLVNAGWVQDSDGRHSITQPGREWLKERLGEFA